MEEVLRYVDFGAEDRRALLKLREAIEPALPTLIERFYSRVDMHQQAREVFTDPAQQRPRLARTLAEWIRSTLSGPYDADYAARRRNIGRVHVAHHLPQRYMVTAMGVVRTWIAEQCFQVYSDDPGEASAAVVAGNKILDVELALMLSTYQDALLVQAQEQGRLATIGALATGLHHHLRNPLASIEVLSVALSDRQSVRADPRGLELASALQDCVAQAQEALAELQSYSAPSRCGKGSSDLAEVVDVVIRRLDVPQTHGVTVDIDPTLPSVPLSARRLEQVLLNIVSNAVEACAPDDRLGIRGRSGDNQVVITVWDEGEGIFQADLPRVGQPFFTTRPHRLGMGLPLTQHIVEGVGGSLEIRSEPGQRTTLVLRFPL